MMPATIKAPSLENRSRGEALRRLREEQGLSQAELAKRLVPECQQQTIGKLEKGFLWSIDWIKRLALALHVEPETFAPFAIVGDPLEQELLEAFRQLDDATKRYAIRSLTGLAVDAPRQLEVEALTRRRA